MWAFWQVSLVGAAIRLNFAEKQFFRLNFAETLWGQLVYPVHSRIIVATGAFVNKRIEEEKLTLKLF